MTVSIGLKKNWNVGLHRYRFLILSLHEVLKSVAWCSGLSVLCLSLRLLKGSKLHLEMEVVEHEKLSGDCNFRSYFSNVTFCFTWTFWVFSTNSLWRKENQQLTLNMFFTWFHNLAMKLCSAWSWFNDVQKMNHCVCSVHCAAMSVYLHFINIKPSCTARS